MFRVWKEIPCTDTPISAAAVTTRDLLAPALGRPVPLGVARALSPLYGALGLTVALAMDRNVIETLKLGYSIFSAGLILPVLAAFLPARWSVPPAGAIAANRGATSTSRARPRSPKSRSGFTRSSRAAWKKRAPRNPSRSRREPRRPAGTNSRRSSRPLS